MRRRLFIVIPLIGGFLIFLSAFAHAFLGWPQMSEDLATTNAGSDLVSGVQVGWIFGSFAMLAFALIVIINTVRLLRGTAVSRTPVVITGFTYVVFGLWAYLARDYNPHFFFFIMPGLMILLILKR